VSFPLSPDPSLPSLQPLLAATGFARECRIAAEIARDAGAILLEGWGTRPRVEFKSEDINLVTEFDRRSEALVVSRLAEAFPDDTIVGEEGSEIGSGRRSRAPGQRVWYVDPLDGTTNFAHGFPLFSVSIGLAVGGRARVGVVEAPAVGWSFCGAIAAGGGPDGAGGGGAGGGAGVVDLAEATEGRGGFATWNGKPIAPSVVGNLKQALVVTGFPYARHPGSSNLPEWAAMVDAAQGTRRLGSAALDLCFVACGWLDVYWERELHPWDLVAGAAIVEAAGGRATEMDGSPFDGETGRVLATNGRLHEPMIALLGDVARRSGGRWP
jgi:myo-inositol-1(or 4)-monophosphatase